MVSLTFEFVISLEVERRDISLKKKKKTQTFPSNGCYADVQVSVLISCLLVLLAQSGLSWGSGLPSDCQVFLRQTKPYPGSAPATRLPAGRGEHGPTGLLSTMCKLFNENT